MLSHALGGMPSCSVWPVTQGHSRAGVFTVIYVAKGGKDISLCRALVSELASRASDTSMFRQVVAQQNWVHVGAVTRVHSRACDG